MAKRLQKVTWIPVGHTWGSPSTGDRDQTLVETYPQPPTLHETDLSVSPAWIYPVQVLVDPGSS